jgi:hypothetical protein
MAKGYQLIQAQTLTSTAASVTFSNIPQNFTDLVVKMSVRSSYPSGPADNVTITVNGNNTSAVRQLYGTGSAAGSDTQTNSNSFLTNSATATANTFANGEFYFPNYSGSTAKSVSFDGVTENNATLSYQFLSAGLYSSTNAITSITLAGQAAGSSWVQNSTFYLYGIGGTRASGGTITADGNYTYHTFTSTGSFMPSEKIKNAEVLQIAGGGGGGSGVGAGGGAGGLVYGLVQTFFAGTSYAAIVGAGGTGGAVTTGDSGVQGSNSQVGSLTASVGGGFGGNNSGGSGGSGGGNNNGTGGTATSGQGNAGGNSSISTYYTSGGGGGSGAVGANGNGSNGVNGAGGIGVNTYISWASATSTGDSGYYAGGGGAGATGWSNGSYPTSVRAAGGLGGGGIGGITGSTDAGALFGTAGTANTGGGGGGGGYYFQAGVANRRGAGGNGGSGIIIVRYPNN